ncbi:MULTISPECIES: L,D-transpeptidase [Pelosinus]|uniref:ErfK/YbiS/YcfS/YnhG family protein n=1 Tax=Pelosinus fermentans B4 TaxID=1149862 RepID=I8RE78_9FIRM|nr:MULTISPECIES: L,D-transpeptidase [Pelosinus]EIW15815.1 ErfK/YbiS/YcfS/YnhG family protein [Pelosinus fermentans B4]EIW27479.1 ErfK/YbiS/YcfS/YnhG family protein [Pelosinus fermentans A11]OAM92563.1 ErfK/YbiS/YcfS/YnhG family protein [Pelosinus fermentans DSM 17108]SDQ49070.1 Lipoprotein-anchoring transpeptidase ErfK/SrfK [Pelosinus fermentans]
MDDMEQGYSRLLKKKQKKAIHLSKQIAFVQYTLAIVISFSILLSLVWLGWQYGGTSVTVASSSGHQVITSQQPVAGPSYLKAFPMVDGMAGASATLKGALPACRIVINLPSRTLDFYNENQLVKTYPVAIGKPATPTPIGSFTIQYKEINPWWYPPKGKKIVPSGPDNPLGYRWMEFAPLYGIHGTNEPWAIGGWVSNGCVRMNEFDVEELFEAVPYGTGVYIQYDLVRIEKNTTGQVSIGVYPDLYGLKRQPVTVLEIEHKLLEAGIPNFADSSTLQSIIAQRQGHQNPLFQVHNFKVNGILLPDSIIASQGQNFVPIWAVANFFHTDVVWDEQQQLVYSHQQAVPGFVKGKILYVTQHDVQSLFGGMWLWKETDNCWELSAFAIGKSGSAGQQK